MIKSNLIKTLLLAFVFLAYGVNAIAQKRIIKKLLSNSSDSTRSASFIPLPAIGYAQETGWGFGIVTLYSFYSDRTDTLTRSSLISGVATCTTKKQSNFFIKTDIWTPQNKLHHTEEIRLKNFPFYYYGVGNNTLEANKELVKHQLFKLKGELQKKITKTAFTGVDLSFEKYMYASVTGTEFDNGKVLFLGVSQIIDSRNINTYTTKGLFINLNYSYAPDVFGSTNFYGSLVKMNFKNFTALNSKLVLGINANYESLLGNSSPFYLLRQLGSDEIMRGYYGGRYRDQNLLAAQAELRYRFMPRFGIVGFAGQGSVYKKRGFKLAELKPSYGAGFRYFFDVQRGLSIRVDYGIGEKPANEKRQKGMYISLGEAF
ncbi:MAG: hypothetical protein JWN56_1697 [Sphingobacteriales bacterium]|nr:hypothetical protein [Sphingobacteriales bacterium]